MVEEQKAFQAGDGQSVQDVNQQPDFGDLLADWNSCQAPVTNFVGAGLQNGQLDVSSDIYKGPAANNCNEWAAKEASKGAVAVEKEKTEAENPVAKEDALKNEQSFGRYMFQKGYGYVEGSDGRKTFVTDVQRTPVMDKNGMNARNEDGTKKYDYTYADPYGRTDQRYQLNQLYKRAFGK